MTSRPDEVPFTFKSTCIALKRRSAEGGTLQVWLVRVRGRPGAQYHTVTESFPEYTQRLYENHSLQAMLSVY